jgi:hypothetical protein
VPARALPPGGRYPVFQGAAGAGAAAVAVEDWQARRREEVLEVPPPPAPGPEDLLAALETQVPSPVYPLGVAPSLFTRNVH